MSIYVYNIVYTEYSIIYTYYTNTEYSIIYTNIHLFIVKYYVICKDTQLVSIYVYNIHGIVLCVPTQLKYNTWIVQYYVYVSYTISEYLCIRYAEYYVYKYSSVHSKVQCDMQTYTISKYLCTQYTYIDTIYIVQNFVYIVQYYV